METEEVMATSTSSLAGEAEETWSDTTSLFARIPPEIRSMIYDYVIEPRAIIRLTADWKRARDIRAGFRPLLLRRPGAPGQGDDESARGAAGDSYSDVDNSGSGDGDGDGDGWRDDWQRHEFGFEREDDNDDGGPLSDGHAVAAGGGGGADLGDDYDDDDDDGDVNDDDDDDDDGDGDGDEEMASSDDMSDYSGGSEDSEKSCKYQADLLYKGGWGEPNSHGGGSGSVEDEEDDDFDIDALLLHLDEFDPYGAEFARPPAWWRAPLVYKLTTFTPLLLTCKAVCRELRPRMDAAARTYHALLRRSCGGGAFHYPLSRRFLDLCARSRWELRTEAHRSVTWVQRLPRRVARRVRQVSIGAENLMLDHGPTNHAWSTTRPAGRLFGFTHALHVGLPNLREVAIAMPADPVSDPHYDEDHDAYSFQAQWDFSYLLHRGAIDVLRLLFPDALPHDVYDPVLEECHALRIAQAGGRFTQATPAPRFSAVIEGQQQGGGDGDGDGDGDGGEGGFPLDRWAGTKVVVALRRYTGSPDAEADSKRTEIRALLVMNGFLESSLS